MSLSAVLTRQEVLTKTQSLNMVRNAIRTALSSIAYLRNMYEEEAFEDKKVGGLMLKLLLPHNAEATAILNWLEEGVFDALNKGYLKVLAFGIHNKDDELLESYHIRVSYDSNGEARLEDVGLSSEAKDKLANMNALSGYSTKEEARVQTVNLLRALVLMTQTLGPLPDARYVSLKLWYHENVTPKDYDPMYFQPVTEAYSFSDVPIECVVGRLSTGHHGLSIKIKSIAEDTSETKQPKNGTVSFRPAANKEDNPSVHSSFRAVDDPQTFTDDRIGQADEYSDCWSRHSTTMKPASSKRPHTPLTNRGRQQRRIS